MSRRAPEAGPIDTDWVTGDILRVKTALVIPCYNEENRLKASVYQTFLEQHADFMFVFVNDGSRDGTLSLLESLRRTSPSKIVVHSLTKNQGTAEAVRVGLLEAASKLKVDYVGFWDADLATPLEDAAEMTAWLDSHPKFVGVFGSRILKLGNPIKRQKARHYLGRFFATVVSLITNVSIYDSQCGAKVFRAGHIQGLCSESFLSKWFFDVELVFRIKSLGKPESIVFEWPVSKWEDVGASKLKLRDFAQTPLELFKLWRKYS